MRPPAAPRDDVVDDYHGTEVGDPYRWLEDPGSERTRAFVAAQNTASRAVLEGVPGRSALHARLTRMWSNARVGVPELHDGWLFHLRNEGLQDQAVLVRTRSLHDPPRIVLDPNTWSSDGTSSLAGWAVSPGGQHVAYAISEGGSDWMTWRVRDTTTGRDLPDVVEHSKFSPAVWLPDGSGFLYGRYPPDETGTAPNLDQTIHLHRLGTPQVDDTLIHARPDQPRWGFHPVVTPDHRFVVLLAYEGTDRRSRLYVHRLAERDGRTVFDGDWLPLLDDHDAEYRYVANDGDRFLVHTDLEAPRGRVIAVELSDRFRRDEVVPESDHTLLGCYPVGGKLFLERLEHAATRIAVADLDGTPLGHVELPGLGTAFGFAGRPDHERLYFAFTSFTRPTEIWAHEVATGTTEAVWAPEVPHDPSRFTTEQHFVEGADGTRVPIFVTYGAPLSGDSDRPTLLYGYGGFNHALTPVYDPSLIAWLELGGVHVSANLRGGGEYGRAWHEDGTLHRKQNVFDDFIATAEWLTAKGITRPSRLAIHGRSNGGLLVGACLVQRPELFGAAAPAVGVFDMLRYHRFTIGWAWESDYGTADDPDLFEVLMRYSPLHNAAPAAYPPTLVMTADHDDRVVPAHSYKFAAALQHAQQGAAPVLLRVETRAGHGMGKSTAMLIEERLDLFTFLAHALGVDLTVLLPEGPAD